jgi:transcriptional regulator with XRE-family HTH domain
MSKPTHHEPEAVTFARERAGLTKTDLAKRLGVSLALISQIESTGPNARNAKPAMLRRIAEELNCPVVFLERKRYPAGDAA